MLVVRLKEVLRKAKRVLTGLRGGRASLDPNRWRYYHYLK